MVEHGSHADPMPGGEAQAGQPSGEGLEADSHLGAHNRRADTDVGALPEGEVAHPGSGDIEFRRPIDQ